MQSLVDNLMKREKYDKLLIANTMFLIDYDARELREQRNPANKISFSTLEADESGNVPFVFDKLTRNIYKGYMPGGGLPPMTEHVMLPAHAFIPPQDRHLLKNESIKPFTTRQESTNRKLRSLDEKLEQPRRNMKKNQKRISR
ncbi:MAG: hypothetical protein JNM57_10880 [Cyclobacteriaceae bacterium]|nr:hypothetical protein [Cyclobacteriaceae bacterium]